MNKSSIGLMILALIAGVFLVASLDGFLPRTEPNAQQVPLPDIAGEFFTTIIHDNSPESSRLLSYFDTDPDLNRIKNRERHNELESTNPYYLENFKPRLKEGNSFPIFLVQKPNGNTCLILSKETMPNSPQELLGHIRRTCHPDQPDRPIIDKIKKKVIPLVVDTVKKKVAGGIDTGSIIALVLSSLGSAGFLARAFTQNQGL